MPVNLDIVNYQNGGRLSTKIEPGVFADVLAAFGRFELPTGSVDGLKPCMAALHLMPHQFRLAGITNGHGIGNYVFEQAVGDCKTIESFGTMSGQLALFDEAPIAEQEPFLRRIVSPAAAEEVTRVLGAYKARDIPELDKLAATAVKTLPKMFEQMILGRNLS